MTFEHKSVLLHETVDSLNIRPDGIYVDGTLGGGGHASLVCSRLGENGRLIGIDQDADAIAAATERLKPYGGRVTIVRNNYENIDTVLAELGIPGVDGIYLDLGVSSYQLDTAERGFTYREDAPLDMRMDQRNAETAADIVNGYSEMELYRIIRDYGEDRFAKNIAKHIVRARQEKPLETTGELIEVIKAAIPAKVRATGGHPAKRTFQAIRIELNKELEVLEHSIDKMIGLLNPGGRLSIITFHSLEDRIVKNKFKENENPCVCPPDFPVCMCGRKSRGRVVTRKPIGAPGAQLQSGVRAGQRSEKTEYTAGATEAIPRAKAVPRHQPYHPEKPGEGSLHGSSLCHIADSCGHMHAVSLRQLSEAPVLHQRQDTEYRGTGDEAGESEGRKRRAGDPHQYVCGSGLHLQSRHGGTGHGLCQQGPGSSL